VEQRQVAAVYRTLAVTLRALGTEGLGAARRGTDAAISLAFAELLGQRPAATCWTGFRRTSTPWIGSSWPSRCLRWST